MGCTASTADNKVANAPTNQEQRVPKWRRVLSSEDARKKYELEGSIPPDCPSGLLELRGFLDEPMLMKHVGMFAKSKRSFEAFMCWVDIQEFKSIVQGAEDYRRSKAMHICNKYLRDSSPLKLQSVDVEYCSQIVEVVGNMVREKVDLSINTFDKVQLQCLNAVYADVFIPFKYSIIYNRIMKSMQYHYNRITPDDFDYIGVLGQGGFGLVVHCKKKTTGKHYALKIQTKMGLLKTYKNVLHRVDYEKQALASCNHPFIVALDYAFQSNTFVFLAMQLGTGGTLYDSLSQCHERRMGEDRVRFYAAEIVLALSHIHGLGMIYRDLKPPNILLNSDGHVQLVDLGGIIDPSGRVLGLHDESEDMLNGLFVKDYARFASNAMKKANSQNSEAGETEGGDNGNNGKAEETQLKRAKSVMGTDGYMAIEMMMLKLQKREERKGYTNAADWWSLGVTMFVLLTGLKPFPTLNTASVALLMVELEKNPVFSNGTKVLLETIGDMKQLPVEYLYVYEKLSSLPDISPDTINIILQLLDFNEYTRLGSKNAGGIDTLKMHRFFRQETDEVMSEHTQHSTVENSKETSSYWDLLEHKQIIPPFFPEAIELNEVPTYKNFEEMMLALDKSSWLVQFPSAYYDEYFQNWNFVSPQTLKTEFGIANVMEQYESKYKARQLLGPISEESFAPPTSSIQTISESNAAPVKKDK